MLESAVSENESPNAPSRGKTPAASSRVAPRWLSVLSAVVFVLALGGLLVGCGTGGGGLFSGTGTSVVALWLLCTSLVGFIVGCGGASATGGYEAGSAATQSTAISSGPTPSTPAAPTPTPAAPTPTPAAPTLPAVKVAFLNQPTKNAAAHANSSSALTLITPPIQVAIQDVNGNAVTTATNAVTISLGANPGGAVLQGTLTVNAVKGIATFSNLLISRAGSGYTLAASAEGLTSATSAAFVVGPLPPAYTARRDFVTDLAPTSVVAGDFNSDGKLDLVTSNYDGNSVSVLPGNGDGTYGAPQNFATGGKANMVVAGDFNGDGKLDLAVATYSANTVSVLLGNGDGTFVAATNLDAGANPVALAVGDFTGDGKLDIVTANFSSGEMALLVGNGDGTFGAAVNFAVGARADAVAVGDFNGDHKLDAVVANYGDNTVSVLLGNGDGTFRPAATFSVDQNPNAVNVDDFNGDGNLDIAVANEYGNGGGGSLSILLGDGSGSFNAATNFSTGNIVPESVAVADVNHDGKFDLLTAGENTGRLATLLGNGDGTFQAPLYAQTASAGEADMLATGDFNGDGKVDVAVPNSYGNSVSVMIGRGDGTFVGAPEMSVGPAPVSPLLVDVNRDGNLDLVVADVGGADVQVLLSNGDGTFKAPRNYNVGSTPTSVVTGDFNGDKVVDLAVVNRYSSTGSVLLGNGDGTFKPATPFPMTPASFPHLASSDFNGDGRDDLAVTVPQMYSNTVSVLLSNGDGTFQAPLNLAANPDLWPLAAADLNGDGKPDLAYADLNVVHVLLGNGDGTFGPAKDNQVGDGPKCIAVGDLNGDGIPDLAVACSNSGVSLLLGKGDGSFTPGQTTATSPLPGYGAGPVTVVIADMNADGTPDLVVANDGYGGNVSILPGNGDATFQEPQMFGAGYVVNAALVGDFNGDGKPDLAVSNYRSDSISILLHN